MSCCYEPGEVVVVPWRDAPSCDELPILYSAEQLLKRNDVSDESAGKIPAPRVHRVKVGEELETARRLVTSGKAAAALPNHYVRPAHALSEPGTYATLNEGGVRLAMNSLWPFPGCGGRNPVVLVLDSGYMGACRGVRKLDACDEGDAETPLSAAHGTVVCDLIRQAAPSVEIVAARVVGLSSTLASLLTGLYLAEQTRPPDVINVSLELKEERACPKCRERAVGDFTETQLGKACAAIRSDSRPSPPVWVAAAGNDTPVLALPARLANVIAVGSYDPRNETLASYSTYERVPTERFVMAFGGLDTNDDCIARTRSFLQPRLFGTSFAAPLVSAAIANYIAFCLHHRLTGNLLAEILEWLPRSCRRVHMHDPRIHGLGMLAPTPIDASPRWATRSPFSRHAPAAAYAPGNRALPAALRVELQRIAYSLWDQAGRPDNLSLEFWLEARRQLGIPSWLD